MVRYTLSKDVKILCDNPDLSDRGKFIREITTEMVFVNIIDTYTSNNIKTIKLKCFYPDGHIEEGWTFREIMCPVKIFNFSELLDGRFNQ